jgi:acetolactate synthase I/II/III large subunit
MEARSSTSNMSNGEAYLTALHDRGIEYIFGNGGTDFAPIIEGYLRARDAGRATPEFVTIPHENVAMAMAQGYYRVSGKMAAVMVHVTVGTANALLGLMNACRDNVPILLAAGRTPATELGHAGSRNVPIHWAQEAADQGGSVREYVKWDYELRAGQPVYSVVERALDIALSEPRGPVYLTLPREILGDNATAPIEQPRPRAAGVLPPVPSKTVIDQAADMIAAADFPMIIAGEGGRTPKVFDLLAAFANRFAIPVVQARQSNLHSSSPMNLGAPTRNLLEMADLLIAIDAPVPYIPRLLQPRPGTKIIHIAHDPTFSDYSYRGFPMDLAVAGDAVAALEMLSVMLEARQPSGAVETRRARILAARHEVDERRRATIEKLSKAAPIQQPWVAHCVNAVKASNAIVINELGVPFDYLQFDEQGCYFSGDAAGGLGSALGFALGAKLAAPERQVITITGDGSYMFGNPVSAHFVGQARKLPTLTIICNNSMWNAVRGATLAMYPDGLASRANALPLVDLVPSPKFEKIIEAVDGYGENVTDPSALMDAIQRGLDAVAGGRPAVLNVVTGSGRL